MTTRTTDPKQACRTFALLIDLQRFSQARALLEQEEDLASNPDALAWSALCSAVSGEVDTGEEAVDRALQVDPNNAFAHLVKAGVLIERSRQKGRWRQSEALEHLDAALALDPDEPYTYAMKAGVLLASEGPAGERETSGGRGGA